MLPIPVVLPGRWSLDDRQAAIRTILNPKLARYNNGTLDHTIADVDEDENVVLEEDEHVSGSEVIDRWGTYLSKVIPHSGWIALWSEGLSKNEKKQLQLELAHATTVTAASYRNAFQDLWQNRDTKFVDVASVNFEDMTCQVVLLHNLSEEITSPTSSGTPSPDLAETVTASLVELFPLKTVDDRMDQLEAMADALDHLRFFFHRLWMPWDDDDDGDDDDWVRSHLRHRIKLYEEAFTDFSEFDEFPESGSLSTILKLVDQRSPREKVVGKWNYGHFREMGEQYRKLDNEIDELADGEGPRNLGKIGELETSKSDLRRRAYIFENEVHRAQAYAEKIEDLRAEHEDGEEHFHIVWPTDSDPSMLRGDQRLKKANSVLMKAAADAITRLGAEDKKVFFYNSINEAVTKAYKGDTILLWDGEHYLLRDFKFFNDSTWDGERNSRIVCYYEGEKPEMGCALLAKKEHQEFFDVKGIHLENVRFVDRMSPDNQKRN